MTITLLRIRRCPACDSKRVTIGLYGGIVPLGMCRACGLMFETRVREIEPKVCGKCDQIIVLRKTLTPMVLMGSGKWQHKRCPRKSKEVAK